MLACTGPSPVFYWPAGLGSGSDTVKASGFKQDTLNGVYTADGAVLKKGEITIVRDSGAYEMGKMNDGTMTVVYAKTEPVEETYGVLAGSWYEVTPDHNVWVPNANACISRTVPRPADESGRSTKAEAEPVGSPSLPVQPTSEPEKSDSGSDAEVETTSESKDPKAEDSSVSTPAVPVVTPPSLKPVTELQPAAPSPARVPKLAPEKGGAPVTTVDDVSGLEDSVVPPEEAKDAPDVGATDEMESLWVRVGTNGWAGVTWESAIERGGYIYVFEKCKTTRYNLAHFKLRERVSLSEADKVLSVLHQRRQLRKEAEGKVDGDGDVQKLKQYEKSRSTELIHLDEVATSDKMYDRLVGLVNMERCATGNKFVSTNQVTFTHGQPVWVTYIDAGADNRWIKGVVDAPELYDDNDSYNPYVHIEGQEPTQFPAIMHADTHSKYPLDLEKSPMRSRMGYGARTKWKMVNTKISTKGPFARLANLFDDDEWHLGYLAEGKDQSGWGAADLVFVNIPGKGWESAAYKYMRDATNAEIIYNDKKIAKDRPFTPVKLKWHLFKSDGEDKIGYTGGSRAGIFAFDPGGTTQHSGIATGDMQEARPDQVLAALQKRRTVLKIIQRWEQHKIDEEMQEFKAKKEGIKKAVWGSRTLGLSSWKKAEWEKALQLGKRLRACTDKIADVGLSDLEDIATSPKEYDKHVHALRKAFAAGSTPEPMVFEPGQLVFVTSKDINSHWVAGVVTDGSVGHDSALDLLLLWRRHNIERNWSSDKNKPFVLIDGAKTSEQYDAVLHADGSRAFPNVGHTVGKYKDGTPVSWLMVKNNAGTFGFGKTAWALGYVEPAANKAHPSGLFPAPLYQYVGQSNPSVCVYGSAVTAQPATFSQSRLATVEEINLGRENRLHVVHESRGERSKESTARMQERQKVLNFDPIPREKVPSADLLKNTKTPHPITRDLGYFKEEYAIYKKNAYKGEAPSGIRWKKVRNTSDEAWAIGYATQEGDRVCVYKEQETNDPELFEFSQDATTFEVLTAALARDISNAEHGPPWIDDIWFKNSSGVWDTPQDDISTRWYEDIPARCALVRPDPTDV